MATDLITTDQFMPALQASESADRYNRLIKFVQSQMIEGKDFGKIPGSDKPTLLKPGAEKLCTFFGLCIPDPEILTEVEDWTGAAHGGEPFFYYKIRQRLTRNGTVIASQFASANSWEKKYRYRNADRKCPKCGKEAIIKGKAEYGGGYLCWGKKNGCNAKFNDGDKSIEDQATGQIPNKDICDTVNTLQKMAQKRALVAAVLLAANASEFFTQDLEDIHGIEQPEPEAKPEPVKRAKTEKHTVQPARGGRSDDNGHDNGDDYPPMETPKAKPASDRFAKAAAMVKAAADPEHLVKLVSLAVTVFAPEQMADLRIDARERITDCIRHATGTQEIRDWCAAAVSCGLQSQDINSIEDIAAARDQELKVVTA